MTDREPTAAENEALRARISALSAASLRISASLDLETVLNEIVDSTRALTGARFAAIATIDEAGAPRTSSLGLHRRRAPAPGGVVRGPAAVAPINPICRRNPINPICRRNPSIPGLCRIASPTCARPFELSLPWSVRLSSAARRCILRTLPCDSSLPP